MDKHVCVIGAGVVGLSLCHKLLGLDKNDNNNDELPKHNSIKITLIAEHFTHQTTTYGCAGLWEPYQILGTPEDLVNQWGLHSFEYFLKLYYSDQASELGIRLLPAYKLMTEEESLISELPSWRHIVFNFSVLNKSDLQRMNLPDRFVKGYSYTTLTIDQKYYLNYMIKLLQHHPNVTIIQKKIYSIADDLDHTLYSAVFNCTGIGSQTLVPDTEVYPIRGQVVRVK